MLTTKLPAPVLPVVCCAQNRLALIASPGPTGECEPAVPVVGPATVRLQLLQTNGANAIFPFPGGRARRRCKKACTETKRYGQTGKGC
ncbi:hypothetical protein BaRGS_00039642 [Batillaria attramentaria]|uniref:Secreted protein n=1 Tax=Batillaria attramentaria TaxID=370345 RepID=A0ABD0J2K1_9CAEN